MSYKPCFGAKAFVAGLYGAPDRQPRSGELCRFAAGRRSYKWIASPLNAFIALAPSANVQPRVARMKSGACSAVISAMPGSGFANAFTTTKHRECPATGHGRAKPQAGTVPWSIGRCAAYPGISADIVRRVGRAAIRFSPPRSVAVGGLKRIAARPTLPLARLELRVLQAHRAPSADTAAAARCFPAALCLAPVRRAGCESPSTAPRLAIAGQLRCTARR